MTTDIESFSAQVPSPLSRAAKLQWVDLSLRTAYAACGSNQRAISSELEAAAQAAGQSLTGSACWPGMSDDLARADRVVGRPVGSAIVACSIDTLVGLGSVGTVAQPLPTDALPLAEQVCGFHERLAGPVTGIADVGPTGAAALEAIGVHVEGEFLTADPARLGEAMKLSVDKVLEMKDKLAATHNLDLRFR